ncbi:hypothetical protein [Nocardioides alcanivorans]|uniref:hypothetical protein n=1 Tax=Nocardioides alcanivorans TaxID=2897352 RepID=UPI001F4164A8|nr:hypothetical protein [Nocardioides alcanivorans]
MSQTVDLTPAAGAEVPGPTPVERLTGMEALVRLLVERARLDKGAGLNTGGLASGYPGSPIGRIHDLLEEQKEELLAQGIHHRPGLNEELAATAIWGSQTVGADDAATVDGVFGLWYAKAPGVDRAGMRCTTATCVAPRVTVAWCWLPVTTRSPTPPCIQATPCPP